MSTRGFARSVQHVINRWAAAKAFAPHKDTIYKGLKRLEEYSSNPRRALQDISNMPKKGTKRKRSSKKRVGSNKKRRKANSTKTGAVVTRQHDYIQRSAKRRLSRAIRRFSKFSKRVKKVRYYDAPLLVWSVIQNTPIGPFAQALAAGAAVNQFVWNSDAGSAANDIRLIHIPVAGALWLSQDGLYAFMNSYNQTPVDSTALTRPQSTNVYETECYVKCTMRMTIKNVWPGGGLGTPENIMVDVYLCVAARDIPTADVEHNTAYNCWINCLDDASEFYEPDVTAPFGVLPKLNIGISGTTPYQAPSFSKYWRITGVKTFHLNKDEIATFSYNSKSFINFAKWENSQCKKGVTRDLIIIACPTYGSSIDNSQNPEARRILDIEWTKHYHYRVPGAQAFGGLQVPRVGYNLV